MVDGFQKEMRTRHFQNMKQVFYSLTIGISPNIQLNVPKIVCGSN